MLDAQVFNRARVVNNPAVTIDLTWIAAAEAAGRQPPAVPRQPLRAAGRECGSIEPGLADRMAAAGLPIRPTGDGWVIPIDADAAFAAMARWLHEQGLCSAWRDEALAVVDLDDRRIGVIERAAVRPLGIATRAVHLVGVTPSGDAWIQQRALDKAVDPGRWDTLMGGLVAAGESTQEALERETWEEAGLRPAQLSALTPIGRCTVRRPVCDGYMVEHIEMFEAHMAQGVVPVNQDGEVERFDCLSPAGLIGRLSTGVFTVEAALVHLQWLRHRGVVPRA